MTAETWVDDRWVCIYYRAIKLFKNKITMKTKPIKIGNANTQTISKYDEEKANIFWCKQFTAKKNKIKRRRS